MSSARPHPTPDDPACLPEETFVRYGERLLADAERAEFEAHVDVCRACTELLAAFARASRPDPRPGDQRSLPATTRPPAVPRRQRTTSRPEDKEVLP